MENYGPMAFSCSEQQLEVLPIKHIYLNNIFREWLHAIALAEYIPLFESQRYTTVRDLLELQWEDFEDIGVKRLGHLKRFGLTIKKLKVSGYYKPTDLKKKQ